MTKITFWKYLSDDDVKEIKSGRLPNLTGYYYKTKGEAKILAKIWPNCHLRKLTLSVECLPNVNTLDFIPAKVTKKHAKECAKAARMT